ncbi:hypothetical protein Ciccas_014025 [Cichlidogyrus casuarinus]|uniref:G-protein coupled receptors family 1 profile domain-containing protein n=1 Tax=Cichlidogyrus casuarinus TaxID=1844966 RepID=A0ABD2PKI8_9PLAT
MTLCYRSDHPGHNKSRLTFIEAGPWIESDARLLWLVGNAYLNKPFDVKLLSVLKMPVEKLHFGWELVTLLYKTVKNCSSDIWNISDAETIDCDVEIPESQLIEAVLLSISIISNMLCTYGFVRQLLQEKPRRKENVSMNKVLLILSLGETMLATALLVVYLIDMGIPSLCRQIIALSAEDAGESIWKFISLLRFSSLLMIFVDFFSIFKNYSSCIITLLRMEAILCPMSVFVLRSPKIFGLILALLAMLIFSIVLIPLFTQRNIVCLNEFDNKIELLRENWMPGIMRIGTEIFFIFMGVLIPWVVIFSATVVLLIAISRASKNLRGTASDVADRTSRVVIRHKKSKQVKNHMKASLAILIIFITYTLFEFPLFIAFILIYNGLFIKVVFYFPILNSILNFFVFLLIMPRFRKQFCFKTRKFSFNR